MEKLLDFIANNPILVSTFLGLLTLLLWTESRKGGKTVTTQQATRLINNDNALVLDVREKKEFSNGHIVESMNIPYAKLGERISELGSDKSRPVIVVDAAGQHAGIAGKTLVAGGFTRVVRLGGGLNAWKGENLPLVKKG
ncbi:rhodanese-like domain-containing protein [Aestuariirhabdus litorea]|uniref:Rhodanese-like domain-containing protein n=1 Tax=Aestuariirhabdus litorea TaxID=2528527 RepID=A0A3P3VN87_9GAMM|nr:rhodanese-like domain-containing protein [Aestuariirhabdus litorea]RRJ83106.1 rhodanese-like domain-containing protein [Aestuariirhabdus litorea]RWW93263.1 rhodanese-like domain-containing protein [Endozoicomonadaceae bacterium GTF-13]